MGEAIIKVVSWFVVKRALIKFDGDEDSMTINEALMTKSDFVKNPILKGDTVEVTIKDEEIVSIKKSGSQATAPKEEKVEEEKVEEKVVETKGEELTKEVYCVSKYGLKFVGDNDWTNWIDELQNVDMRSLGVVAKNTITVVLQDGKIVEIKKVEAPAKATEEKPASTKKASYRDEEATDKRTASMNAKDVIVALINSGREEVNSVEKIEKAINGLINKFYAETKNL